ncbi:hypothetical protein BIV57_02255 [Mangrovactinospora gilvigrisea]|uniref:Secreted protein n=1 Tax=Mangrovactinospora gilvigrisea TaxID=1428644 RepID=A0A1J7BK63_9ACTN|nr:DUF6167 family protein [Mangrovactinospora gilvigrisea]OIV39071.1 hypothetical protein BIV57_02255 [Mangrovactinospora gilvigrisea]
MRRLFWLTVGAGLGGWAVHKTHEKINEARQALTPESIAGRVADRARGFADDVREGAAEREAELNRRLGREPEPIALPEQQPQPRPGFGSGRPMDEDGASPLRRLARGRRSTNQHRKDDH